MNENMEVVQFVCPSPDGNEVVLALRITVGSQMIRFPPTGEPYLIMSQGQEPVALTADEARTYRAKLPIQPGVFRRYDLKLFRPVEYGDVVEFDGYIAIVDKKVDGPVKEGHTVVYLGNGLSVEAETAKLRQLPFNAGGQSPASFLELLNAVLHRGLTLGKASGKEEG